MTPHPLPDAQPTILNSECQPADAACTADPAPDLSDDEEPSTGPLRRCIVTRESFRRETMLRFVVGPDNVLVPDLAAKLPGRGIWLSARGDVLETARSKGAFSRAARTKLAIPADLPSILVAGLSRRIGEALGLSRRAGQSVCGYQKVREWLQAGRAGLIVQASDGSVSERARLVGDEPRVPVVAPLPGQALGAIFGRDHVVHVAVLPGRLASAIEIETDRLTGLLAGQPVATTGG